VTGTAKTVKPELNITSPFFQKNVKKNKATLSLKLTFTAIAEKWRKPVGQQQTEKMITVQHSSTGLVPLNTTK